MIVTRTLGKTCSVEGSTIRVPVADAEWIIELVQNIRECQNADQIRQAEKEFHREMLERYGGNVAGLLLQYVWEKTKKEEVW